jgi:hypothetical protein
MDYFVDILCDFKVKHTHLDALWRHFSTHIKCVIYYIFIVKQGHRARAVPTISKELFEESTEETQEKVMSLCIIRV